jgi:hypothetical protein
MLAGLCDKIQSRECNKKAKQMDKRHVTYHKGVEAWELYAETPIF